jgi:hypothetical protein
MQLSDKDADDIYRSLSIHDREIMGRVDAELRAQGKITQAPFEKLRAKDRMWLCVSLLRAAIVTAQKQFADRLPLSPRTEKLPTP